MVSYAVPTSGSLIASFLDGTVVTAATAVSTLWTPSQITTLGWWDANDADTITETSGAVSQWDDKSGNARHVSQATGSLQPTYTTDQVAFDGAGDVLILGTPFLFANGSCDVFVVADVPSGASSSAFIAESDPLATQGTQYYSFYRSATTSSRVAAADSSTFLISSEATTGFDGSKELLSFSDTGSLVKQYQSGTEMTSDSYTRGTPTLTTFSLGGNNTDVTLNEVVLCNNLSEADRQTMEGYLAHKWGLDANLPSGHPYKNVPPVV